MHLTESIKKSNIISSFSLEISFPRSFILLDTVLLSKLLQTKVLLNFCHYIKSISFFLPSNIYLIFLQNLMNSLNKHHAPYINNLPLKIEATTFYNLIFEMTFHHFCHNIFIWNKSSPHRRGKDYIGRIARGWRSLEAILEAAYYKKPKSFQNNLFTKKWIHILIQEIPSLSSWRA